MGYLSFKSKAGSAKGLCTADDLHDLLRDVRLALPVGLKSQVVDQLGRVLRRAAHRGHARAVLGSRRLEQRTEDRDLDVVGHQAREDLLGARLVNPERARLVDAGVVIGLTARAAVVVVPVVVLLVAHHVGLWSGSSVSFVTSWVIVET